MQGYWDGWLVPQLSPFPNWPKITQKKEMNGMNPRCNRTNPADSRSPAGGIFFPASLIAPVNSSSLSPNTQNHLCSACICKKMMCNTTALETIATYNSLADASLAWNYNETFRWSRSLRKKVQTIKNLNQTQWPSDLVMLHDVTVSIRTAKQLQRPNLSHLHSGKNSKSKLVTRLKRRLRWELRDVKRC